MICSLSIALVSIVGYAAALSDASTRLWYSKPANNYQEALPVGNGRLGANVFGSTERDMVVLNEDSVWSGGYQERVNAKAISAFPDIVEKLNDDDISAANSLWMSNMPGTPTTQRVYQAVGNMTVQFDHDPSQISSYNRTLDLTTGLNEVSYAFKGVQYTRQAIASYPMGVLGFRYVANQTGALSLDVALTRDQAQRSVKSDLEERSIMLKGGATADGSLNFTAGVKIVTKAGTVKSNDTALMIQGSEEVIVYFDAEGAFRHPSEEAWEATLNSKLDAAVASGWSSFSKNAIADYQKLAGRVTLDLGNSGDAGAVETSTRLKDWKSKGNVTYDPELLALTYNYGRFLLIGSSRDGGLPANLQGIWNDQYNPKWGSKYTININIQMNYWPAQTTNLAETHGPLFDHLLRMQERGRYVAEEMYGLDGWVCHHNTDIWGDCAPQDSQTYYAANTMGGAWLALDLIDHFRFTRNATFAESMALPLLGDALTFFYDFLILKPDGHYVTSYGTSPENSYLVPEGSNEFNTSTGIDQGPAHDRQILWELLTGYIEISEAIGSTKGVCKAKHFLSKIRRPDIGSLGQLLEWSGDYVETEPGHRHLSHLIAVYPGSQVSPLLNKTISNAALTSINRRMANGSGNMGWSRAWAAGIYARLFQGEEAVSSVCNLISTYLSNNLFDLNGSTFQIDGNLGLVGAFTEVLLQSHTNVVHLAPALPGNVLAAGSIKGLVARGGFVVDMSWSDHKLVKAEIKSLHGEHLALRVADGTRFTIDGSTYTEAIPTESGKTYTIAAE